jgi:NhaA family Na+:H+ antiporter
MTHMLHTIRRFIQSESSAGVLLGVTALAALAISNSPWAPWYEALLAIPGEVRIGEWVALKKPLVVWVNDLWMAVFFFLVGLEIKRELTQGELSSRRQAILPAGAALGGMAVPALIYAAVNAGDATALRGWAIPAATDIAFALGILMLLGSRVPLSLKVFLTAVAIIDDLGAIVVIAIFYTEQLSTTMLLGATVCTAVLIVVNRLRVDVIGVYVVVGVAMWLFVLKSGVHATLAGVITALAVPMRSRDGQDSPLQTAEHALHPWVAYLVLPAFAFVNAGVSLEGVTLRTFVERVPMGIALGLVVGKAVGVFGASWLLVRLGVAAWPENATRMQFLATCMLCGIGFTMSLFIGSLAFEGLGRSWDVQVKLGVLGGSLVAALLGSALMLVAGRAAEARSPQPA